MSKVVMKIMQRPQEWRVLGIILYVPSCFCRLRFFWSQGFATLFYNYLKVRKKQATVLALEQESKIKIRGKYIHDERAKAEEIELSVLAQYNCMF